MRYVPAAIAAIVKRPSASVVAVPLASSIATVALTTGWCVTTLVTLPLSAPGLSEALAVVSSALVGLDRRELNASTQKIARIRIDISLIWIASVRTSGKRRRRPATIRAAILCGLTDPSAP